VALHLLDGHEQREVVQPARVRPAEIVEAIAQDGAADRVEAIEDSRPERLTMGDHGGKVDRPGGEDLLARHVCRGEQPVLEQPFEADQQRIPRKRRKALVRGIAVASRSERQHLPQTLAGGGEEIDKRERTGAEVTDAEASRQRCRMQEHATGTTGGLRHR
jgi:hypothetical protein